MVPVPVVPGVVDIFSFLVALRLFILVLRSILVVLVPSMVLVPFMRVPSVMVPWPMVVGVVPFCMVPVAGVCIVPVAGVCIVVVVVVVGVV